MLLLLLLLLFIIIIIIIIIMLFYNYYVQGCKSLSSSNRREGPPNSVEKQIAKSSYGKLSKLVLGWYNSNLDRTALEQNQKLQAGA